MTTQIDGKQIVNMLYHAGVETLLTVGYSELGRKLLRRQPPKVDFNMADLIWQISVCYLLIYYLQWQLKICWLNKVLFLLIL